MTIDVKFQELNGELNADFGQITQVATSDHRKLQHREDTNQHPMSAITGLEKALTDKLNKTDLPTAIDTALTQAKASGEFDGEDGADGKDGYTPIKGVDYFDGVNGKDGANGKDGKDGRTPEKGVDYWTPNDKAEIVNEVLASLPNASGVSF